MNKLLRRRVYCREVDYEKHIRPQCAGVGYHRWSWAPVSIDAARGEMEWNILKGSKALPDKYFVSRRDLHQVFPSSDDVWKVLGDDERFGRRLLSFVQYNGWLYNPKYQHWSWKFENDGIYIRYFKDKPWVPVGIATVERDY